MPKDAFTKIQGMLPWLSGKEEGKESSPTDSAGMMAKAEEMAEKAMPAAEQVGNPLHMACMHLPIQSSTNRGEISFLTCYIRFRDGTPVGIKQDNSCDLPSWIVFGALVVALPSW